MPESLYIAPFSDGRQFGVRFTAPITLKDETLGVLVGDIFYTPAMIARYAKLSQTEMNVFAGRQLSVGTLESQQELEPEQLAQFSSCDDLLKKTSEFEIVPLAFDEQEYYQGQCVFHNSQDEAVGAMTIGLPQVHERRETRKILASVLTISGIVVCAAFVLSLFFSRRTLQSIQHIVSVIGDAAEGDLRSRAVATTHDEIGMLANKLNQMIEQLRSISGRVQAAASTVNGTADTILRQVDALILHMGEQSTSVDSTSGSIEQITLFIRTVSQDMSDLLEISELVLSSIQQTQSNVKEVTTSTKNLVQDLQSIVPSVEQSSQSMK